MNLAFRHRQADSFSLFCLVAFDQLANSERVGFAVAVAGDGVSAAGGIDANVGTDDSGRNLDGCNLSQGDAFFVAPKQAGFYPADVLRRDDNAHREKQIAPGPAAGSKGLGAGQIRHAESAYNPRPG